jgi:hypothetical protein
MLRVNLMFNYFQIIYIYIASREYNLKNIIPIII